MSALQSYVYALNMGHEVKHTGTAFVAPWLHSGVSCDICSTSPISGYRYNSLTRPNYDLCSTCFRRQPAESQRGFRRIDRTKSAPPFHITYISCYNCGTAPIKGPRYRDKLKEDCDLCEKCFTSITRSKPPMAREDAFEKILQTKLSSFRKKEKKHGSGTYFHFNKKCDECSASPIKGPCYTSLTNTEYDLCAYCHDEMVTKGAMSANDFTVAFHPDPQSNFHFIVWSCSGCGVVPVRGPAYKNLRKDERILCLLCFLHIKEEKIRDYQRVDPPPTESSVYNGSSQAPHVVRSKSVPLQSHSHSEGISQRSESFGPGTEPLYKPRGGPRPVSSNAPDAESYAAAAPPQPPVHPFPYGGQSRNAPAAESFAAAAPPQPPVHPFPYGGQSRNAPAAESYAAAAPPQPPVHPFPYGGQSRNAPGYAYSSPNVGQPSVPAAADSVYQQAYNNALRNLGHGQYLNNYQRFMGQHQRHDHQHHGHQHHDAYHKHQKEFFEKLMDNIQQVQQNSGGNNYGYDPSQYGNNVDWSQYGNNVDWSQYGNNVDWSSLNKNVDWSSLANNGAFSSLASSVNLSSIVDGVIPGAGVMFSLLKAVGGMNFRS